MQLTTEHSFPDEQITSWHHTGDVLMIEISGVHYAGRFHDRARIAFAEIRRISCMVYDAEKNNWVELPRVEPLKDICELHMKLGKHYSLKGFGAESGQWIAVGILSEKATIEW